MLGRHMASRNDDTLRESESGVDDGWQDWEARTWRWGWGGRDDGAARVDDGWRGWSFMHVWWEWRHVREIRWGRKNNDEYRESQTTEARWCLGDVRMAWAWRWGWRGGNESTTGVDDDKAGQVRTPMARSEWRMCNGEGDPFGVFHEVRMVAGDVRVAGVTGTTTRSKSCEGSMVAGWTKATQIIFFSRCNARA
jgi:hypothetical protein